VTVQKKTTAETSKASNTDGNFLDLDWGEEPASAPKPAPASAPKAAPAAAPATANDDGWGEWSFGSAPGDTAFAAASGSILTTYTHGYEYLQTRRPDPRTPYVA